MHTIPCHCSICNKLFTADPNLDELTCPYCNSPYAHYADATCKGISHREWKNDETTAPIVDAIPNTSDSDSPNTIGASYEVECVTDFDFDEVFKSHTPHLDEEGYIR